LNVAVTIFWLIGITNAINSAGQHGGLAAGVAAIAAGFLAANFGVNGHDREAQLLAMFAAVLVGFLLYNSIQLDLHGRLWFHIHLGFSWQRGTHALVGRAIRTFVPVRRAGPDAPRTDF